MNEPTYAHGSTAPPLDVDLVRGPGRLPVALPPEAVVTATVIRPGSATITINAPVTDFGAVDRPARVRIPWDAGDLINAGVDELYYRVDLDITTNAGVEKLPAPLTIKVRPASA